MAERLSNPFKISELVETVNNLVDTTVDDSNLVHKTGDETISGVKTFTGDGWITKIQNTNVTYNTAPSSDKGASIIFTDKNGTQMGCVETRRYSSNNTLVRFNAYSPNGNWASQPLELMVDANDNVSAFAPTPDTSDNSTKIATTAWVKNQGYMSSGNIFPNNTWVPVGDDAYMGDHNQGGGVCIKGNNNSTAIYLYRRDETVFNGFKLDENDLNGLKMLNPTQGAQAWWSVTAMVAQSLGSNGYIKFNHGLIIQWGTSTNTTVTYPTAFSNTNYSMVFNNNSTTNGYGRGDTTTSKTTTGFVAQNLCEQPIRWIAIGY